MSYRVKEIYYTLQGEGANVGRPAVFCRFEGCNLWTGWQKNRKTAICKFCDTDFLGINGKNAGEFKTAASLAGAITKLWPEQRSFSGARFVVCTGGEPLLQLDGALIKALHKNGFEIAIETNGTLLPPKGIDWTCVSPKAGARMRLKKGDELKLVFPQKGADPKMFEDLKFRHFYLQPMDGKCRKKNTSDAAHYCLKHPRWNLSLQIHKIIGLP